MSRSVEAVVKSKLLVWARESAGMEIPLAAKKLNVSEEKILDWESGIKNPTVKQLRKAANVYKQSFAAFYLSEPPKVFRPPIKDYRRLPGSLIHEFSSDIIMDIRSAIDKREICLELFSEKKESIPEFNLKTSIKDNPEFLADKIRIFLGVSIQAQSSWRDNRVAFNK